MGGSLEKFVALHLGLPTSQIFLNLVKVWGRYGVKLKEHL
jgi:hypothetical protein